MVLVSCSTEAFFNHPFLDHISTVKKCKYLVGVFFFFSLICVNDECWGLGGRKICQVSHQVFMRHFPQPACCCALLWVLNPFLYCARLKCDPYLLVLLTFALNLNTLVWLRMCCSYKQCKGLWMRSNEEICLKFKPFEVLVPFFFFPWVFLF